MNKMRDRRWYRVDRGGHDSASLVEGLARAIPLVFTEVFTIRSPEVRAIGSPWSDQPFHDGRTVRGSETLRLVGGLLDDPRFWCELESCHVDVHVSEDAIYLGLPSDVSLSMTVLDRLHVEAVAASPYVLDDVEYDPYRPANAEFWKDLQSLLDASGSLIFLSQWAAGLGGEQWYFLRDRSDISVVRAGLVPRSILAAFGPACFVMVGDGGPAEIESFAASSSLYGNLRWLTPGSLPRLGASMVNDELDLREKCKVPRVGAMLFAWPEADTNEPMMAACPDEDGVVRTAARFA